MKRFFCISLLALCGAIFAQEKSDPPASWSVVRNENIVWRKTLPEGGQSAVVVAGGRAFTTMHRPINEGDSTKEPNIVGLCLDAKSGEILWGTPLPGTDPVEMSGIFSDATVFAPIADEKHVWFFNRCGSMGCFEAESGKQVWLREFTPRPRHTNRQCDPMMVDDLILTVEVRNKEAGLKMARHKPVPEGVEPRDVWTYLHAIDKNTGEVRWIGTVGTSVHNTPRVGKMADGTWAVAHGRGGGHGPLEKPYGVSLTRVSDGKTLWSADTNKGEASFQSHWDSENVYWWRGQEHLVFSTETGELLRSQPVCDHVDFTQFDSENGAWSTSRDISVKAGKKMPLTNQTNALVGEWHYFLAHDLLAIGRVNVKSGKAEYLQLPAQKVADSVDAAKDRLIWEKKSAIPNDTKNSRGISIAADKRAAGTGFGHVSAAMPVVAGKYLFVPIMNGTVFVIDTSAAKLDQTALVSINDLGPAGETWTLSHFIESDGRLYIRTMKEVICIGLNQ